MPAQSLGVHPIEGRQAAPSPAPRTDWARSSRSRGCSRARRWCRSIACSESDTIGPLDVVILVLFALLYAWTAFAFLRPWPVSSARIGRDVDGPPPAAAAQLQPHRRPAPNLQRGAACPVRPAARHGRLGERHRRRPAFDFFVLSDTTSAEIQAAEHALYSGSRRASAPGDGPITAIGQTTGAQGRQYRRLGAPVRRRLRQYGGAGRRQPDRGRDPRCGWPPPWIASPMSA